MALKPSHSFLSPTLGFLAGRNAERDAAAARQQADAAAKQASWDVAAARVQFEREIARQRAEYEQTLLHAKKLIHSEAAAKEALARALHAVDPEHPLIIVSPDGSEMALDPLDDLRRRAYEATAEGAPLHPRVVFPVNE